MNNWPDPLNPGYPPFDGTDKRYHWLYTPEYGKVPCMWDYEADQWFGPGIYWQTPTNMAKDGWVYVGPCYTQQDLNAAVEHERMVILDGCEKIDEKCMDEESVGAYACILLIESRMEKKETA